MELVTGHIGWIEIVCGPMFSGKSEELIRRLRRARIARKRPPSTTVIRSTKSSPMATSA